MNRQKRKMLKCVIATLQTLADANWSEKDKIVKDLSEISDIVGEVCDMESDAADNLPENMQLSDRYFELEDNASTLSDIQTDIDSLAADYDLADTDPYQKQKKTIDSVIKSLQSVIDK